MLVCDPQAARAESAQRALALLFDLRCLSGLVGKGERSGETTDNRHRGGDDSYTNGLVRAFARLR